MKKISILSTSLFLGALAMSACSTSQYANSGGQDNMYFMASDAKLATEYAVQNNNPESFESLGSVNLDTYPNENFSSKNVNPEYIAKYSNTEEVSSDDMVYFDEGGDVSSEGDINAYNDYRVNQGNSNNGNFGNSFFPTMSFSMGYMGGFSPWGYGYMPFYEPFMMPGYMYPSYGFGFRPGFSMGINIGFGIGFGSFWGPSYAWGGYPGYGWGGYPSYGWGGYPGYINRPIYVLPGGEYGDRRIVRGARSTRGAGLANASNARSSAILPNTSRAQARNAAVNSPRNRSLVSGSNNSSRVTSRDFGNSQNDYYTSRSRVGTTRNVSSPAVNRTPTRTTRSAMPSSRPSYTRNNVRTSNAYNNSTRNNRGYTNSRPSYNRSSSPSYNRSNIPARRTPTYSPSRTTSPTRSTMSTPSRSSGSSVSTGSRSSGSSVSRGSSRGGRGN
ncbi:hypothetical protein [Algoriphagus machipongonensis]|uniref:Vitellogenin II n=1 Tax=Algoriphagus machipongonensis TaxID=388413 RepID=A3I107_9BACT|nr:hypothetical protein [Algoriphagus machipongonensis]EAZ80153.2 hypothetical protein ALPR1_16029 [Algoriphagus machipongonensis]